MTEKSSGSNYETNFSVNWEPEQTNERRKRVRKLIESFFTWGQISTIKCKTKTKPHWVTHVFSSRLLVFTLRIGWQPCKLLFCSLVWTWGQYVSGLWWWPPLRLSKRRSPLPTAVLLRTTLTRTIRLHNHFARIGICDPFGFGFSTLQWKLIYH